MKPNKVWIAGLPGLALASMLAVAPLAAHEGRLLAWLGGWHPAAVHFLVALVLTAAFLEALAAVRRRPAHAAGVRLLLAVAAAGAVVAAPLGWAGPTPVRSRRTTASR